MGAVDKRYKKTAKAKAKEYLRKKRGYKSKEEKKAFKIAEKFRISQWRKGLALLDEQERKAQLKAFRQYTLNKNLVMLLILAAVLLAGFIATLVIML